MGLAGFELTSATGTKFQWTPTARASWAVIRPKARACSRRPAAPNAIAWGNWVAPSRRLATPTSKSAATRMGSFDSCCKRFRRRAASSGRLFTSRGPRTGTLMARPPTWYRRRFSRSST
jgi:hypothetical protein